MPSAQSPCDEFRRDLALDQATSRYVAAAMAAVVVIGHIQLVYGGETDDKLLAVQADFPLGKIDSLADLDREKPGITAILKTWFENDKGSGKLTCSGFGSRGDALELLTKCEASFARNETK